MLTLPQELILLAYDEHRGTVTRTSRARESLGYCLGAAIILELLDRGRLTLEWTGGRRLPLLHADESFPDRLMVVDQTPTGDEILDNALAALSASTKERSAYYWIEKLRLLAAVKGEHVKGSRLLEQLTAKGIVRKQEHRSFGFINRPRFFLVDAAAKEEIKQRLRSTLAGGLPPGIRTIMLLGLAWQGYLLGTFLPAVQARQFKGAPELLAAEPSTKTIVGYVGRIIDKKQAREAAGA